jgi:hypothetical protein
MTDVPLPPSSRMVPGLRYQLLTATVHNDWTSVVLLFAEPFPSNGCLLTSVNMSQYLNSHTHASLCAVFLTKCQQHSVTLIFIVTPVRNSNAAIWEPFCREVWLPIPRVPVQCSTDTASGLRMLKLVLKQNCFHTKCSDHTKPDLPD